MEHAEDALDGRPRGKKEMLANIHLLDIQKGDTFVSNKWGAPQLRFEITSLHNLTERSLPHEIVNHSAGEIMNENGFTTNAIEAKWSVVKRWVTIVRIFNHSPCVLLK